METQAYTERSHTYEKRRPIRIANVSRHQQPFFQRMYHISKQEWSKSVQMHQRVLHTFANASNESVIGKHGLVWIGMTPSSATRDRSPASIWR